MFFAPAESYFRPILKEGNFKLLTPPDGQSRIVLSRIKKASGQLLSYDGYALFVPVKGAKRYTAGRETYEVNPGEYLLLNHNQPCQLWVNSPEETISINVRLHKNLVGQTAAAMMQSTNRLLDDPETTISAPAQFQPGINSLSNNLLGQFLQPLLHRCTTGLPLALNGGELYYELAAKLVQSQVEVQKALRLLPAQKLSTKKELFRRLQITRKLMTDNPCGLWDTASLAQEAALSEAHFLRSFKAAFGISPHQYLVQKKMDVAANSLRNSSQQVIEIAYQLGYSDLPAFSHAFKKHKGVSPVAFRAASGKKAVSVLS